jgi:hypothetical protein
MSPEGRAGREGIQITHQKLKRVRREKKKSSSIDAENVLGYHACTQELISISSAGKNYKPFEIKRCEITEYPKK